MTNTREPLLIFDCDGVLVDSEPLSIRVLLDTVAAHGGHLTETEAYQRFLGRSMATLVSVLDTDFDIRADAAFLERMRRDLYARFEKELQPIAGIARLLRSCPGANALRPQASPNAFACRLI